MEYLAYVFMAAGGLFFLGGTVGLLRMPDFFTRLHPAGKMDTIGSLAMLLGLALLNLESMSLTNVLVSLKILLCVGFLFIANPTATHAIVEAGMRAGLPLWNQGDRRR